MASHLTPEQRIDKNGKLVTRHVLAKPSGTASSLTVVNPTISNSGRAEMDREDILLQLKEELGGSDTMHEVVLKRIASTLDDDDIESLLGIVTQEGYVNPALVDSIVSRSKDFSSPEFSRWLRSMNDNHYRLYVEYSDEVQKRKEPFIPPSRTSVSRSTIAIIDGLEGYADRGIDLSRDQENEIASLTKLIHFASIVRSGMDSLLDREENDDSWSIQEKYIRIGSDDLIRYVLEGPDNKAEVEGHLRNPQVTRGAELLELVFGKEGTSALVSGVL